VARIPYLDKKDLPEEYRTYFDSLRLPDGRNNNIHRILAYRPKMLQLRAALSRSLSFDGPLLEPRIREIALLTIGRVTRCLYEYHHHVQFAKQAGLTDDEITALPVWENHPSLTSREKAVIRYAEEMTLNIQVRDTTFEAVSAFFPTDQLVELTLVIAHYNSTVRLLEALEVRPGEAGGE
jgi:alkylhydroperoxidase family enzyme